MSANGGRSVSVEWGERESGLEPDTLVNTHQIWNHLLKGGELLNFLDEKVDLLYLHSVFGCVWTVMLMLTADFINNITERREETVRE